MLKFLRLGAIGTRCFIGFFLPKEQASSMSAMQDAIKNSGARCKMVEKGIMHVCLSFLGDVSDEQALSVSKKLEGLCSGYNNFDAVIGNVKLIPNESRVRVVVVEISDRDKNMEALQADITKTIGGDAKPPHATLCRVSDFEDKGMFVAVAKRLKFFGDTEFKVGSMCLIKSELGAGGPVYYIVSEAKLSKA